MKYLKFQQEPNHCKELVETIKIDILFVSLEFVRKSYSSFKLKRAAELIADVSTPNPYDAKAGTCVEATRGTAPTRVCALAGN